MVKNKKSKEKPKAELSGEILEEAEKIRKKLCEIEGINTAIIANTEGKLLGSGVPAFAQAAAEIARTAGTIAEILCTEKAYGGIFNSNSERIIVTEIGSGILLAVNAKPESNQQLVSTEIRGAVEKIRELMKQKRR